MTDQNNLARLVRDPSTGEMAWLKPSTDDLDLLSLRDRLDDTMLSRVEAIARAPLSALPPCDSRRFAQSLRMMLAVLPRRQADDLSGELFVAAYERQLGHYPAEAVAFLCDEAIRTLKWFPTVSECLEIIIRWRRRDSAVERQEFATALVRKERIARDQDKRDQQRREMAAEPITQEAVDAMPHHLIKLGLSCGALIRDNEGRVIPAPPEGA